MTAIKSETTMKILRTAMLFTVVLGCCALSVTASAIPMWEFLSRGEKVRNAFMFCYKLIILYFVNLFLKKNLKKLYTNKIASVYMCVKIFLNKVDFIPSLHVISTKADLSPNIISCIR